MWSVYTFPDGLWVSGTFTFLSGEQMKGVWVDSI